MKGTLRLFLVLCVTALSMTLVQAQERTYSGVVKGSDGQPIIGASVEVVGTTVGTSTGLDGDYTIKANQGSKIKFSFLGTKSVTATAGTSSTINVTLEDDATALDEVVVQAFGTAKKKDLTGAVSSIDSKLISSQSNSTLSRALEGAIPGLQVAAIDGQPGADMGIRIRGIGTASQDNANALIVIDGVPNTNTNVLATLNPKDIESITVLKDAASTALWGSRGANGVVMVTTKKGQQGRAKVTFEGRWGINMIANNGSPNVMRSVEDNYEMMWQSIYNTVRYGSNEAYTTNVAPGSENMTHDEAALFASQHLFDYVGNTSTFQANSLANWMYYKLPGGTQNYKTTGSGNVTSATMLNYYLIDPKTGKISSYAEKLYDVDNWEDLAYQKAFRQEYNLSVSGATDKTDYYISAGYLEDPSYISGSKFNRFNVRSNINTQVNKWLKAGINMAYSRRDMQSPATRYGNRTPGTSIENVFYWVNGYSTMPSIYQRDENGNMMYDAQGNKIVIEGPGQQYSPLGTAGTRDKTGTTSLQAKPNLQYMLDNDRDEKVINDLNMRGYIEAKFLKDFTFQASVAVDQSYQMQYRYVNNKHGNAVGERGGMGRAYWDYLNVNMQQTLNWNHDYGKHHVDALIGHEYNWWKNQTLNYKAAYSLIDNFDSFTNFLWHNAGGTFSSIGGGEDREALEGYFLRANYNYANKYYVTGSVRFDGSSKFRNVSDRWGTFWSIGGAWRISAEPWAADATWLTDLKLRADYGVIGNQNGINRYSGYQTWSYGVTEYTDKGSYKPKGWKLTQGGTVNSNLTWERKKTVDVGLDFRLWDRFYGTIDWYQTNTKDMIWNAPLSYAMAGQSSIAQNSAEMRTRGFEIELGVDIIKTPDILWSFSVNGAHYKSILTSVPEGTGSDALNGCWTAEVDGWAANGGANTNNTNAQVYLRGVGKPYYNLYMFKYGGVDQASGLPLFASTVSKDNIAKLQQAKHVYGDIVEGNTVYTTNYSLATRQEVGDATPDFIGGFSTAFRWKNLDLSAVFAFQIGGKYFSTSYGNWYYYTERVGRPLSTELKGNTWTPQNTGATHPMQFYSNKSTPYANGATLGSWMYSDMSLFNASYLNVKNITVGYNFPQKWMDKIGIGGIRVYASLDNFWMITEHQGGWDPRTSLVGGFEVGAFTYPYMRTCSLGVNVTF